MAEYSNELPELKKVFDLIVKNIGDLNLELSPERDANDKDKKPVSSEKKTITKTIVLSDGTYSTQTIVVDPAEAAKQKETKFLRKFILETNFYFSTCLAVSISKIIFKIGLVDSEREIYNAYFYNSLLIICALLKLNSHKVYKDPDNVNRIQLCLEFLMKNQYEEFLELIKESREIFIAFQNKQRSRASEKPQVENKIVKQPDEFISFRHVKPFDSENLDLLDDDADETSIS